MKLTIGSRGSQLALWQAHHIEAHLNALGVETSIRIIRTTGDQLQTASLTQAGGKGLFTKEIEEALLAREIDLAVHSLKDLPTENPPGLCIAAIPPRQDPRDAIVGCTLADLKPSARVGTSSNRRKSQLLALRPDLQIEPVRGNVDTRLRKLHEGHYDAIVLAAAGLKRLGLDAEIAEILRPDQLCPAPGQGALAVQTRCDDPAVAICAQLNDRTSAIAVDCERAVLAALGGGCQLPIAAFAEVVGESIQLTAGVFAADGSRAIRASRSGATAAVEEIARSAADELLQRGAHQLLLQAIGTSKEAPVS